MLPACKPQPLLFSNQSSVLSGVGIRVEMADRDDEMIEKISAIAGWLSECDLEDYLPVLLENGYNSLAKCMLVAHVFVVCIVVTMK